MSKYTKELLEPIVRESHSWAGVTRRLIGNDRGGNQGYIKSIAVMHGIDFSHFTGRGWRTGKTGPRKNVLEYFVKDCPVVMPSSRRRHLLLASGLKEAKCEKCLGSEWQGEPMPLELDHINGDYYDNRLENLQVLCANCHSLKTAASRKK